MTRAKDASPKSTGSGASRVRSLQREFAELETDLERARRRRDKAQARLEALEAIAEQLAVAIASAEAADGARAARRAAADAAAVAASQPPKAPKVAKGPKEPKAPKEPKVIADAESSVVEVVTDQPEVADALAAPKPRRTRRAAQPDRESPRD